MNGKLPPMISTLDYRNYNLRSTKPKQYTSWPDSLLSGVEIEDTSPLPPRRRIEQPLPVHLIRADRRLPFGREQPIREHVRNGKLCAAVFLRAEFDDVVAVDQARVVLDRDDERALVMEAEPGAAVGERIGVHRACGVEGLAHAAADVAIPFLLR
jgi:hypothetical protein